MDKVYSNKLKIVFLDIETLPIRGLSWQSYDTNLLDIENPVKLICVAYAINNNKIVSLAGDEKTILENLQDVFKTADVIVTYNGENFDLKILNTRFLHHNMKLIPAKIKSVDLLKIVKKYFRLEFNSLDYVTKFLGLSGKKKIDLSVWLEAMRGSKPALNKIRQYNSYDVALLRKLFEKLNEFCDNSGSNGFGSFLRKKPVENSTLITTNNKCPKCNSLNTIKHGYSISMSQGAKRRLSCINCGKNFCRPLLSNEKLEFEKLWNMK